MLHQLATSVDRGELATEVNFVWLTFCAVNDFQVECKHIRDKQMSELSPFQSSL